MTTLVVFLLLCLAAVVSSVLATNYCSLSCTGVKHIGCRNNGKFAPPCPDGADIVTMTAALRNNIVNAHNAKRNFIASGRHAKHKPACRMATMQWDNELASLAALNVRQCTLKHDECHNTDVFENSGQNLARLSFAGTPNNAAMFQEAINLWFAEVKYSKMRYINSFPNNYRGPDIGHFTVMVADRNIRVGCAAATYKSAGNWYKTYLVACNYATTNMVGGPIYAKCSRPGTKCKNGMNRRFHNLCAKSEVYALNKW